MRSRWVTLIGDLQTDDPEYAEPGDVIFGFAANLLDRDNPLIYVGIVTAKVYGSEYYNADSVSCSAQL